MRLPDLAGTLKHLAIRVEHRGTTQHMLILGA